MRVAIGFVLFLSVNVVFACSSLPAEFFVSNNTNIINLQTACHRLKGIEQSKLRNSVIYVMQKNHIKHGKCEDILGMYHASNKCKITADNSEHFIVSLSSHLSNEKIFSLAKELAVKLEQDSVVVFIPDRSRLGKITVSFISQKRNINEIMSVLYSKLSTACNQNFSLYLMNESNNLSTIEKVAAVEWLGSKIDFVEIKRAFPLEKVTFCYGRAYLVYQNGQREQL